jgi:hypothetical protein
MLTVRAVAHRRGLRDPQIWRVLPKGRSGILFLVACDLQMRQAEAVVKHDALRRHTVRGRVAAHVARMLAFDFEPGGRRSGAAPARLKGGVGGASSFVRLSESWMPA